MLRIAVVSQKGGVGKTTLSTNLAAASHLDGQRTLIVDHNAAQGSALDWYRARAERDSPLHGVNVVPLDSLNVRQLAELERGNDTIILDTPPQVGDTARNAAVLADVCVIAVEPAYYSMWALDYTLSLVDVADSIREQLDRAPIKRLIVLNKYDGRERASREAFEALSERPEFCPALIGRHTSFVLTSGMGETPLTVEPNGKASASIHALYGHIKTAAAAAPARLVA